MNRLQPMQIIPPIALCRRMNEYGRERKPFLFVVDFEMTEGYFVENPLEQTDLYFEIHGVGNKPSKMPAQTAGTLTASPLSPKEYKEKFDVVYDGLTHGKTVLTNLTVKTPIRTNLSLEDIFLSAGSPYQLFVLGRFVCFSPECFVRISEGEICTFPMKGTIDAAIPDAEQVILADRKETDEHQAAVDLLRNDMRMSAEQVQVRRFRYIDRIRTNRKEILQVSSEIVGTLPGDYHSQLGDILFRMLPAGSIAGAPKASTIDVIRRAEKETRGYYTGVFGYFDGHRLDSGVLIRFIEEQNGQQFFRSGGGITRFSDWEKEYNEVLDKIYLPTP